MKRFLMIFLSVLTVSGCAPLGRGIAEAILDKNKKNEDTRKCQINGHTIDGLEQFFSNKKTVKIMMIHGVGTHSTGYSARIRNNISKSLNLNVLSRTPKNIVLLDPSNQKNRS